MHIMQTHDLYYCMRGLVAMLQNFYYAQNNAYCERAKLMEYHSLALMYMCTEVFKESTPIAGVSLSCLNVSVYRGLQREHPHYWGTTLLSQCICVQRSLSEHLKRPLGARLNTRSENSDNVTPMHGVCVSHLLSLYILFVCTRITHHLLLHHH